MPIEPVKTVEDGLIVTVAGPPIDWYSPAMLVEVLDYYSITPRDLGHILGVTERSPETWIAGKAMPQVASREFVRYMHYLRAMLLPHFNKAEFLAWQEMPITDFVVKPRYLVLTGDLQAVARMLPFSEISASWEVFPTAPNAIEF
jgi:hypothetical protein